SLRNPLSKILPHTNRNSVPNKLLRVGPGATKFKVRGESLDLSALNRRQRSEVTRCFRVHRICRMLFICLRDGAVDSPDRRRRLIHRENSTTQIASGMTIIVVELELLLSHLTNVFANRHRLSG